MATFATCCTGTGAELLNRDKGGIMAVDTQWATREEVAQDREKVQALTVAQVQDREKLSRLDEKIENSVRSIDRQWATREEVAQDRERVQALTAAQAQDRDKLSRLDEKIENSVRSIDRHSATKEDVEKAIDSVQSDIKSVQSDIKSVQSDIKSVQSDIKSVQIEQAGVKASLRWITWLLSIGFSTVIALLVAALVQFLRLVGGG